jgi:hypothetical protein
MVVNSSLYCINPCFGLLCCSVLVNNAVAPACHPEFKEFHQASATSRLRFSRSTLFCDCVLTGIDTVAVIWCAVLRVLTVQVLYFMIVTFSTVCLARVPQVPHVSHVCATSVQVAGQADCVCGALCGVLRTAVLCCVVLCCDRR